MTTNWNEPVVFACFGAAIMFFSILVGRVLFHIYGHVKFLMKYNTFPRLITYDPARACVGSHVWQKVNLAVRGIEPGIHQACAKCGTIAGNLEVMLSDEAVQMMREIAEQNARKAETKAEVAKIIHKHLTAYLERNFPEEINDPEYVEKLLDFGRFTVALQEEARKAVAEENQLDDILDKANWTKDNKGNA